MTHFSKILSILLLLIFIVALPTSFISVYASNRKPIIIASIDSLASIAREIAGEYAYVTTILPSGVEPHAFILRPDQALKFANADIFLLTGHFKFEETIIELYNNSGKYILTLDSDRKSYAGYNVTLLKIPGLNGFNIHGYWIYPFNALQIARALVDALIKVDPQNKDYYIKSLKIFEERVNEIIKIYQTIRETYKLNNSYVVIAFPAEEYFVKPLGVKILASLILGHGLTISGYELNNVRKMLLISKRKFIIASDIARLMGISTIIRELSQETNASIIYIDIIRARYSTYSELMTYNLGILNGVLASHYNIYSSSGRYVKVKNDLAFPLLILSNCPTI